MVTSVFSLCQLSSRNAVLLLELLNCTTDLALQCYVTPFRYLHVKNTENVYEVYHGRNNYGGLSISRVLRFNIACYCRRNFSIQNHREMRGTVFLTDTFSSLPPLCSLPLLYPSPSALDHLVFIKEWMGSIYAIPDTFPGQTCSHESRSSGKVLACSLYLNSSRFPFFLTLGSVHNDCIAS